MKKLESTLTNMVVVLVAVALIMGSLLAYVNHMTAAPIAAQAEKTLADGIKTVMQSNNLRVMSTDTVRQTIDGKEYSFIIHHTQNSDKNATALGAAVESTTLGFGGNLRVLVGFNTEGTILGYTILESSETPGLGAKADKWFQRGNKGNVIGKTPVKDNLTVTKDGGSVDAITASTITSRAFLLAVNQAYAAYMQQEKSHKQLKERR